jgi:sirohydrochlorin cobaltochelatase
LAPPSSIFSDRSAIVLLGHGSREQQANADFEQLGQTLQPRWAPCMVVPAYVELAQPPLSSVLDYLATLAERVVVLPCFVFTAGHVKNDLPLALSQARRARPHVEFQPAFG